MSYEEKCYSFMNAQPTKEQMMEYLISNTIDHLVEYLVEEEQMPLDKAMEVVYRSETIKLLQIPEGELFVQSPAYVYELLKNEIIKVA